MDNKGQNKSETAVSKNDVSDAFVLEKSIFSNVFDKDIRRVYIYKKAERLARAIHLVSPAFAHSDALRRRASETAIAIVDAAVLPPREARSQISRELLSLSSFLAIARTGNFISPMNADLISREAHLLLEEIASYEEPRVSFEHVATLAELSRATPKKEAAPRQAVKPKPAPAAQAPIGQDKGHIKDNPASGSRREAILSVLRSKGPSYIKDVSTVIRNVSEKTIQRELLAMVGDGTLKKEGERRWTRYFLPS